MTLFTFLIEKMTVYVTSVDKKISKNCCFGYSPEREKYGIWMKCWYIVGHFVFGQKMSKWMQEKIRRVIWVSCSTHSYLKVGSDPFGKKCCWYKFCARPCSVPGGLFVCLKSLAFNIKSVCFDIYIVKMYFV